MGMGHREYTQDVECTVRELLRPSLIHSTVFYWETNIFINLRIKLLLKAPRNPPRHLNFSSEQPSGPKNPLKRP